MPETSFHEDLVAMLRLVQKLDKDLAEAMAPDPEVDDIPERTKVRKCLAAVNRYLFDVGLDAELCAPLLHLSFALEDASEGRSNPLLEPAVWKKGVQKKLGFERQQLTMAAAAVTILHKDGGQTLGNALSYVSRKLGFESKVLAEYRKSITRGRGAPKDVQAAYSEWCNERRLKYPDTAPAEHVDRMLVTAKALQKVGSVIS